MSLQQLAAATSWLTSFIPNSNTTTMSKGLSVGCFYRSPLRVWTDAGWTFPDPVIAAYDARLKLDFEQRGGIATDDNGALLALDPKFNSLALTSHGKNLHDPMHFGILPLYEDLALRGSAWAFSAMLTMVASYFVNEKFPYLRDGGNAQKPYGTQGRLRIAGWALLALASLARVFKAFGVTGPWADFVVSLIREHLKRIRAHWPLIADPDGPNGDHLDALHLETFMISILAEGLRQLRVLGFDDDAMGVDAEALVIAAKVGDVSYVYDLRVTLEGNPLPKEPTDGVVNGWGGTNSWLTGALGTATPEYGALLAAAKLAGGPTKYLPGYSNLFGIVE